MFYPIVDQHNEIGEPMTREFLYSNMCKIEDGENCSSVIPSTGKYISFVFSHSSL